LGYIKEEIKEINFQELSEKIIKRIFSFFNVVDLTRISGVCKKWKHLIEKDPDIFSNVNLAIFEGKYKTLDLIKIVQGGKNIK